MNKIIKPLESRDCHVIYLTTSTPSFSEIFENLVPRGPMVTASGYEPEDSRFESWRGRFIFCPWSRGALFLATHAKLGTVIDSDQACEKFSLMVRRKGTDRRQGIGKSRETLETGRRLGEVRYSDKEESP